MAEATIKINGKEKKLKGTETQIIHQAVSLIKFPSGQAHHDFVKELKGEINKPVKQTDK